MLALAPCPTGWDYNPELSVDMGRLAVQTGVWPLKEFVDGKVVHTRMPRQCKPVREYLKRQDRFKNLVQPQWDEKSIAEIQAGIDACWEQVTG